MWRYAPAGKGGRLRVALGALMLASVGPGCESLTGSDITGVLQVESVEIQVLESFPVQISAVVRGSLGDACTTIGEVSQSRDGNTANVTITTTRPRDAICAQVLREVQETVRLSGSFPPGDYVVRVNGVSQPFRT